MKKAYYYFFYKVYKAIQYTSEPFGDFLIGFKTSLVIVALEIWFCVSLLIYYNIFICPNSNIIGTEIQWILMVIILVLVDYFIFHHNDQWKKYNQEFDQLPKKKNNMGSWIVFLIVLLIISNFIFSFYLYYQT